MEKFNHLFLLLMLFVLVSASSANAEPTRVNVHVISKGAKFIGSSVGGAQVTIKEVHSGAVLAEGITSGGTGDTEHIMKMAHPITDVLSDKETAVYQAVLELDEPKLVEISAYGPLSFKHAANAASVTQWLFPGKDIIEGDGILIEIPGFVVDILSPAKAADATKGIAVSRHVEVKAKITMMCGCPLEPGGLWDANRYELKAVVTRDKKTVRENKLRYVGEASTFKTDLELPGKGTYELSVYAFDPKNGNSGLQTKTIIVD